MCAILELPLDIEFSDLGLEALKVFEIAVGVFNSQNGILMFIVAILRHYGKIFTMRLHLEISRCLLVLIVRILSLSLVSFLMLKNQMVHFIV